MSATTTADEVPPEARPLSEEEQKTFDGKLKYDWNMIGWRGGNAVEKNRTNEKNDFFFFFFFSHFENFHHRGEEASWRQTH
jgi:hypothetical protein